MDTTTTNHPAPVKADRYQVLRDAIAAGPTPGPWFAVNDGTEDEPMMSVKAARIAGRKPQHVVAICATGDSPQRMEDANAALIAAADPGTIAKLLKERDSLRAAIERIVEIADRDPFQTVGFIVEHVVDLRAVLAEATQGGLRK